MGHSELPKSKVKAPSCGTGAQYKGQYMAVHPLGGPTLLPGDDAAKTTHIPDGSAQHYPDRLFYLFPLLSGRRSFLLPRCSQNPTSLQYNIYMYISCLDMYLLCACGVS